MKEFTSHIDYLIQKHDCVIIPDFGGFVLNREVAKIAADGSIQPPSVGVGFNPNLKYNDGLLAESYMNTDSLSYDMACKRIADVVGRLNTILALKQPVQIGMLGKLSLDSEGRLSFVSNANISASHAETFGLSALDIKKLVDIQEIQKVSVIIQKRFAYRKVFAGVGAAAAAVLVFFVTSTPISENTNIQKSGLFTDLISSTANRPIVEPSSNVVELAVEQALESSAAEADMPAVELEVEKEEPKIENVTSAVKSKVEPVKEIAKVNEVHKYFVIIGSGGSKSEAQRALKAFKGQGFTDANIVSSTDRNRIYIASFANKNEAEKYRSSFVSKNPKLSDAWVYTKRN